MGNDYLWWHNVGDSLRIYYEKAKIMVNRIKASIKVSCTIKASLPT